MTTTTHNYKALHQDTSIQFIKGIGPKRAQALSRLGYETVGDLFYLFPRKYQDRSRFLPIDKIKVNEHVTLLGEIARIHIRRIKRLQIFELVIRDNTGVVYATWFNQVYLKKIFREGDKVVLSGKVEFYKRLQLSSPEYEILSSEDNEKIHTGRIVPIYPLSEGLWQRTLRSAMNVMVETHADELIEEFLPYSIMKKYEFMDLKDAIKNIHFPESEELLSKARQRIIYNELFLFQFALFKRKKEDKLSKQAFQFKPNPKLIHSFEEKLPFEFTQSQKKVINEIFDDLSKEIPMRRLLQGDVGSGKTVVAALGLLAVVKAGFQAALLVPTEILAEQHYKNISSLLSDWGVRTRLLTGSHDKAVKTNTRYEMKTHNVDIVIGTHALLQEGVKFSKLGLVVIDEQHKFGVRQRAHLIKESEKNLKSPHLLIMTATPIPRTLGLTLYGDLEISTIDELPKGRQPVKTYWITKTKEQDVFSFIVKGLEKNQQAYIVFPLIEESEKQDLQAAKKAFESLSKGVFKDFKVGLVHGKLDSSEKDKVMKEFYQGKIHVLVATSVIEVGIDNPNATLMLIQHAERFGLSALHQLRGRVGRGSQASYCFLFGNPKTDEGKRRLRVLTKSNDGFKIAEEDLLIRGPGDFLGTRQSGVPQFVLANLIQDYSTLVEARKDAQEVERLDPGLEREDNAGLKLKVDEYLKYYEERKV